MVRSRIETTISIRKLIIFHHSSGKSVRNVAKLVNLSHSTGQYVIKHFKEENRTENKVRKSRPAKLTERDQRFIIRKFVKNPSLSALKVSAEFNEKFSTTISPETVQRVLRASGLNGCSARRKFFVSEKNRKLSLSFAKSTLNKPETYWNNVLFADESKFNIFGSDGRILVWRRKKNEELNPKNLVGTATYGGRDALVWECMSASGLGNLVFFDGIMNHALYLNILKDNLKLSVQNLGIGTIFLNQDNDPMHTALNVRLWCHYNCPQNLKTSPQSPDLNPIEHIWRELEVDHRQDSCQMLIVQQPYNRCWGCDDLLERIWLRVPGSKSDSDDGQIRKSRCAPNLSRSNIFPLVNRENIERRYRLWLRFHHLTTV
ncbi:Transposable element Tc1 transposase [Araneus ventricosus]|uniref:Transposable element Tc1 transposase n=1 Tax=Araneus ventricosus TaxID=182803 RepID=A0A4Y2B1G7_ARAVE|nr:Transposable element Tc1 transposase [Araneus ventricosus]